MSDPSILPDGAGPIAAAIIAVGSAIAWAVKAGLNRVATSFDRLINAVDSNTTSQHKVGERITAMESVVEEGREDIREMKAMVQALTPKRVARPGRRVVRAGTERGSDRE